MQMNYVFMGQKIRALRKQHSWKQDELAFRAGISVSFLGHIERGSRKASIETLISLANVLGVGCDYLLSDELNVTRDQSLQTAKPLKRLMLREISRVLDETMIGFKDDEPIEE